MGIKSIQKNKKYEVGHDIDHMHFGFG